jgi:hypothetical protein
MLIPERAQKKNSIVNKKRGVGGLAHDQKRKKRNPKDPLNLPGKNKNLAV